MFYFSYDENYLYFDITKSCFVNLSEEERFIAIRYEIENDRLMLTIDGKSYTYKSR